MVYKFRSTEPIRHRGTAVSGTSTYRASSPGHVGPASSDEGVLPSLRMAASALLILMGLSVSALAQTNSGSPVNSLSAQPKPAACDVACIRNNSDRVARFCAPRIEAQAPIDFEWISRPFGNIFQEAEPAPENAATVHYRGDSIRFLSPQREWTRVSYECIFDTVQDKLATVKVRLGRLNGPAAPQAPVQGANPAPQQNSAQPSQPPARQVASDAAVPSRPKVKPGEPSPIEIFQVKPRPGQLSQ
jgi:hypothetical protein